MKPKFLLESVSIPEENVFIDGGKGIPLSVSINIEIGVVGTGNFSEYYSEEKGLNTLQLGQDILEGKVKIKPLK